MSPERWPAGPSSPDLEAGTIDVWWADLAGASDEVVALLCAEERARAERMARARDGVLWARSRGILRALLGRYLQVDGATLSFAAGPHGKPALVVAPSGAAAHTPPPSWLSFNLSHAGDVALYAFARDAAVGVDVEMGDRDTNAVGLARRLFGAKEASRLEHLDERARRREFIRLWVRYEAALKYAGVGIHGIQATDNDASQLWIQELELNERTDGDEAMGAVAAESQPRELRCWCYAVRHANRDTPRDAQPERRDPA